MLPSNEHCTTGTQIKWALIRNLNIKKIVTKIKCIWNKYTIYEKLKISSLQVISNRPLLEEIWYQNFSE